MALIHGAAHAPIGSLGDLFSPELSPRMAQTHQLNARNSSTTGNNTLNMFVDSINGDYKYAASIVTACVDQTVFAIQCTAGPPVTVGRFGSSTSACGPSAAIFTVTSGASTYAISTAVTTSTVGTTVTGNAEETCALAGTTAATCTATIKATAGGTSTSSSTVETLSGTSYRRFDVEITGGAEKTASPTATCAAKSAAASFNPKNVAIWALAGVFIASFQTLL